MKDTRHQFILYYEGSRAEFSLTLSEMEKSMITGVPPEIHYQGKIPPPNRMLIALRWRRSLYHQICAILGTPRE